MTEKTKLHGATLPDGWTAQALPHDLMLIERSSPDAKWDGGMVTLDFKRRIFAGGSGSPHCQAQHLFGDYAGRGWKKQIIEDACEWLEKEMA